MKQSKVSDTASSTIICTSCKLSDKLWCVINPRTKRLHRVTFSSDVAHFLARYDEKYIAKPFRFIRGKVLAPGDISKSGLYAIIGTKKDLVLRATLFSSGAQLLAEDESRHIEELFLIPIDG